MHLKTFKLKFIVFEIAILTFKGRYFTNIYLWFRNIHNKICRKYKILYKTRNNGFKQD